MTWHDLQAGVLCEFYESATWRTDDFSVAWAKWAAHKEEAAEKERQRYAWMRANPSLWTAQLDRFREKKRKQREVKRKGRPTTCDVCGGPLPVEGIRRGPPRKVCSTKCQHVRSNAARRNKP